MDKIKIRQICFLFAVMMPVTKMLIYPTTIAYTAKNDLLFSALINLAIEGVVIGLLMLLAKKTRLSFFGLVENTFGKVAAKIVYGIFALFFFISALLPLTEQKVFVMQVFYENVPSIISFAPFFFVSFYACVKGFKCIGRAADIAMPVFAVAFTVIMLLSVPHADFGALLPVEAVPFKSIVKGSLSSFNWFTDCAFLLFFMGNFEYEKNSAKRVIGSFAIGGAAVLLFLATFYGIFADIAVRQQNTIAQIAKYTTSFTSLGRIDLLFIFALTLVMIFYLCVPLQMCVHCVRKVFNDCRPAIPSAAVNALMLGMMILLNYFFNEMQQIMLRGWYFYALFAYAVPLLALLLKKKKEAAHE